MEELKTYFDELEDVYDSFVSTASEVACYAVEHPELEYDGTLETLELELTDYRAERLLEEGLVEAQNLSTKLQDSIQEFSKEMKLYRDRKDEKPEEFFNLGDMFSELREQFREIDSEVTELMREFDRTDVPEINKQRAVIGTREGGKLASQINYEPR